MQHKFGEGPLLDSKGNLVEPGYSFHLDKTYKRSDIKAGKLRIKEWDYYLVGDSHVMVAFTIADNSYMGLASASIIYLDNPGFITKSSMSFMPNGKLGLPEDSNADSVIKWEKDNWHLTFEVKDGKRYLDVLITNFNLGKDLKSHIELSLSTNDSMVIATPWPKKAHFYYNEKKNCMIATGFYEYGDERHEFKREDSRAVLDWGRGVWTYKNTWYWATMSGVEDGIEKGLNLGYGFGDTSAASENMLFYDKKAYKLEDCSFNIPKDSNGKYDYMSPWTFTSTDGSINLNFKPIIDRSDYTSVLVILTDQHQVFGHYSGTIKVDGKVFEIRDLIGPTERVTMKY